MIDERGAGSLVDAIEEGGEVRRGPGVEVALSIPFRRIRIATS